MKIRMGIISFFRETIQNTPKFYRLDKCYNMRTDRRKDMTKSTYSQALLTYAHRTKTLTPEEFP